MGMFVCTSTAQTLNAYKTFLGSLLEKAFKMDFIPRSTHNANIYSLKDLVVMLQKLH